MMQKQWHGQVPVWDDFGQRIVNRFVDGRTVQGPWAIMNNVSFERHGVGLGPGRGQLYEKQGDAGSLGEVWVKIDG